jgi:hypothetical protein
MQRSQRTGLFTWFTISERYSEPLVTPFPPAFVQSVVRGSATVKSAEYELKVATAGAM